MSTDTPKGKHCDYNNFKRARYFHGMLMTDRDFTEEQLYHNEKRKMLNRMLHGWGVVCGLKVKATSPPSSSVVVEPGFALDCHGNEIIVCEEETIDLSAKPCTAPKPAQDDCAEYQPMTGRPSTLYVVIRYHEAQSDLVPVYAPGGSCEEKTCDYSRTHEGYCIEVWGYPPESPGQKTLESGQACTEAFPCPDMQCCPDPHYIAIATITCGARKDGIFSKRVIKMDHSAEIRYSVERTLDKVCIRKTSGGGQDLITVNDRFEFETRDAVDEQSIKWEPDWQRLTNMGFAVSAQTGEIQGQEYHLQYTLELKADPTPGLKTVEVPVSLTYSYPSFSPSQQVTWSTGELPILGSPVEIGIADVQIGKAISAAMIRNVERRKYVATFPWFAWLSEVIGEDGPPWSGDASVHCMAERIYFRQLDRTIREAVKRFAERLRKDVDKQAEGKIKEAVKDMKEEYKSGIQKESKRIHNYIAELDKRIKNLEPK